MRWILVSVALSLVAPKALLAAKDEVMVQLLRCQLNAKQSENLGFYFGREDKQHKLSEIILQQAASRTGLPLAPRYDIVLRALDETGQPLRIEGAKSVKHLRRVVVHPLEEGLAVAYDRDEAAVKSFLLTSIPRGSYINFVHDQNQIGQNYVLPDPIDCDVVGEPNLLEKEEKVDLSALKDEQLVKVVDSYLGVRTHDPDYSEAYKKLGLTKAEYTKLTKEIADYIVKTPLKASHQYVGTCEKTRVARLLTAKDHTGQVLGYRLKLECADYQRTEEKLSQTKAYRIITPYRQNATVYFSSKLDKVGEKRGEEKGYAKHVKVDAPPSEE